MYSRKKRALRPILLSDYERAAQLSKGWVPEQTRPKELTTEEKEEMLRTLVEKIQNSSFAREHN